MIPRSKAQCFAYTISLLYYNTNHYQSKHKYFILNIYSYRFFVNIIYFFMRKNHPFVKSFIIYIFIIVIIVALGVGVFFTPDEKVIRVNAPTRKSENGITLTFNVYQGKEQVENILKILKEYNVGATFFIGGCWAIKNAETVRKIDELGFTIGSHGYYHYDHSKLNYRKNLEEIEKSIECLEGIINKKITLFAPPSGAYNDDTLKASEDLGLKVILWSKDTIDWRDQDVDILVDRATKNIKPDDIILMHPTKATVIALPRIIENILAQNMKIA